MNQKTNTMKNKRELTEQEAATLSKQEQEKIILNMMRKINKKLSAALEEVKGINKQTKK